MRVRVGQQFTSAVDSTSVVVVRAPAAEIIVTCGGLGMVEPRVANQVKRGLDPAHPYLPR